MFEPKIIHLTTEPEINDHISWLNKNREYVVLDTETTSLNPRQAQIVDIQISGKERPEVVIFPGQFALCLSNLTIPTVLHNFKYDYNVLNNLGITALPKPVDTMLLSHLVDENREHSLESWVLEMWRDNYKTEFWSKNTSYHEAPVAERERYAAKDIIYTELLYRHLKDGLELAGIPETLVEHVHRLAETLRHTELEGINVDLPYLTEKGVELQGKLNTLGPQMRVAAETECRLVELALYEKELSKRKTPAGKANVPIPQFSFTSSKQLAQLLYEEIGLPPQKNEKTKQISTDYDSLEKIKHLHPAVVAIQDYRTLNLVNNMFIKGTIERMQNGRIYPSLNINGTATGRISGSNPNLQQLPADGGIRGIYVPDNGNVFISADFSSLEVVLEANLTQDVNLKKICLEGLSKHDITSKELSVSRTIAKTLNFALQYWCSHFKVAKILGIPPAEGLKVYNRYWEIYRGCRDLKAATDLKVKRGEALVSLFGRKRRLARPTQVWSKEYRQGYNFIIQSPGADITSRAAYLVDDFLRERSWGHIVLTVHDELLASVRPDIAEEAQAEMIRIMINVGQELKFNIPLTAVGSGPQPRWVD